MNNNITIRGEQPALVVYNPRTDDVDAIEETKSVTVTDKESSLGTWAQTGNKFYPVEKSVDKLEPGNYVVNMDNGGNIYFEPRPVDTDDIILFEDDTTADVINEIQDFWTKKETFKKFGFVWKRGFLLYGPPGSGKTSTIHKIVESVVEQGGISIFATNPNIDNKGLKLLRDVEPEKPLVVILEDIDSIISNYGDHGILAMLDGELQVNNVVFIATTNYIENLEDRIKKRPSRFDNTVLVDFPSEDNRRHFLSLKNPRIAKDKTELEMWVKQTNEMTIAHLKELVILVECFGHDFNDAINRIHSNIENRDTSSTINKKPIGFKR